MRKPVFYYFAGVLSTVAVFLLAWWAFDSAVSGSDYNVISTTPSPDGQYVATVYSAMGGGAAGWCSIRVTVNPASEPFSVEREKGEGKYVVFHASCGSEVETRWEGDRNLLVTYRSLNKDSGISIFKRPADWHRAVRIRYVEE